MAKKEESVTKLNINFSVITWQRSNIVVHKAKRLLTSLYTHESILFIGCFPERTSGLAMFVLGIAIA